MLCSVIPVILKDLMEEGEIVEDWLKRRAASWRRTSQKVPQLEVAWMSGGSRGDHSWACVVKGDRAWFRDH